MHLYQYLPGTFKATSNTSHDARKDNNNGGSIDMTASTAKSSIHSNKTPAISNLSRHKFASQQQGVYKSKSPSRQRSSCSVDQHRPCARRDSMGKQTHGSNGTSGGGTSASNLDDARFQITVGHGYSQEESVVSEITNPTTMTYPKVGAGYSDSVTVHSDLTIPTVMTGTVPEEEFADLNEWHAARVRAAAATTRHRPLLSEKRPPSLSSIQEGVSTDNTNSNSESTSSKREKKRQQQVQPQVSFVKETKAGRYTSRDIDDRLSLLKTKSMKSLDAEETTGSSSSSSSSRSSLRHQEEKKQENDSYHEMTNKSSYSSSDNKSWMEEKQPTRTPSEMMEEVVWTTLLHLEEQSVCDEESVATPILKHRGRGGSRSVCSDKRKKKSSAKRSKSQTVDRSQVQTFSFVW